MIGLEFGGVMSALLSTVLENNKSEFSGKFSSLFYLTIKYNKTN